LLLLDSIGSPEAGGGRTAAPSAGQP
jgi:hypothetical protein